MYLILVKYFYYFYFLKKNKKFKFFILLDLMFFLMKKYFKLLILKKKLNKYKNILKQIKPTNEINKNLYFLLKLELFIANKVDAFNSFIINFLPTQLLPLGNRKKFYNLFNKKFRRFFVQIKKKLNKKFFFFYLVFLFRKIKFLFFKSDAFLNKKNFLFDFFSIMSFESKYTSLLQLYRQVQKKDSFIKNKFLSFFNLIFFFLYRIDFFLYKYFNFFSLEYIRRFIFSGGVAVNNNNINTVNYYLPKYALIKIPSLIYYIYNKLYIFSLQLHINNLNNYIYKKNNNLKFFYYHELFKKLKKVSGTMVYLKQIKQKTKSSSSINYINLLEDVFYYFFKLKNKLYNYDLLNHYKNNYKIEYLFPFFIKEKKVALFINVQPNYINNISFFFKKTNIINNLFDFSFLLNYLNLFFFFYKYRYTYIYSYHDKVVLSPFFLQHVLKEQKKLFYYFSIVFHINIVHLL